ncbi:MAG TPA: glycosyltransferase family 1 protein [Methylocella sp.]|nr:glycosyltransferase family 1 protein [Methylocella sp.]
MRSTCFSFASDVGRANLYGREGRTMRIGILGHGLITWGGGIGFAALITSALVAAGSGAEIHLFLPLGNDTRTHYPAKEIILDAFASLKDRVTLHVIEDGHYELQVALTAAAIDAALPALSPLPPAIGVPWAGYIYDFQHRYLPVFFTEEEIRQRDTAFLEMATTARAVVVNSKKVKSDISKFIPDATAKVFAMPFAPFLDPNWMLSEDEAAEYASAPYFIICNQFWIHKDHGTAIRAFAKIAKDHPNVNLVCTGYMNDYRAPNHMRALVDEIGRLGIDSRVKLLGVVPKPKQMQLLRNSLALIQPTLFEGGPGGGAVYDAVGLGVPALVSNIEVNQEVDCGDVRFFEAGNPNELAQLMLDLLQGEPLRRPDSDELLKAGTTRLVRCGSVLLEALAFVRQESH